MMRSYQERQTEGSIKMALDPTLQRILNIVSKTLAERRKAQGVDVSGTAARTGLRAPGIRAEQRASEVQDVGTVEAMLADMLTQQRGEERQERLTEEEWNRKLGLDKMDFQQQVQFLNQQEVFSAEESQKQRDYNTEREELAYTRNKKAQSKASQAALSKLLLNVGLGVATGGVGAAMGLMGTNILGGAALGGLSGGEGASKMIGQGLESKAIADWYKQYGDKLNSSKTNSDERTDVDKWLRNKLLTGGLNFETE